MTLKKNQELKTIYFKVNTGSNGQTCKTIRKQQGKKQNMSLII